MPKQRQLKIKVSGAEWTVKWYKSKLIDKDGDEVHADCEEAKRLIRMADNLEHSHKNTLLHEIGHAYLRNHEALMTVDGLEESICNVFAEAIEELYAQPWFHELMKKDQQ